MSGFTSCLAFDPCCCSVISTSFCAEASASAGVTCATCAAGASPGGAPACSSPAAKSSPASAACKKHPNLRRSPRWRITFPSSQSFVVSTSKPCNGKCFQSQFHNRRLLAGTSSFLNGRVAMRSHGRTSMSALLELAKYGQSYWLDDLSRHMIESGELKRRVSKQGLTGVTDNAAIFNAALTNSDDYDAAIGKCAGQHPGHIYETLIVCDVRDACDILRPVYDRTEGRDGFVSLEVSPELARDTQGSIMEARRLWKAVARPNLFIKIPGTREGVPAVETLLIE